MTKDEHSEKIADLVYELGIWLIQLPISAEERNTVGEKIVQLRAHCYDLGTLVGEEVAIKLLQESIDHIQGMNFLQAHAIQKEKTDNGN